MQDIGSIEGSNPLTPEETKHYQNSYHESFELFQKALTEYNKPNVEYHKREQLKKVMDESLQVMNETAAVALEKGKQAQEKALETDYENYINDPTEENKKKLMEDINSLK